MCQLILATQALTLSLFYNKTYLTHLLEAAAHKPQQKRIDISKILRVHDKL